MERHSFGYNVDLHALEEEVEVGGGGGGGGGDDESGERMGVGDEG